jgi:Mg2+ and Co2+ transporter CorA
MLDSITEGKGFFHSTSPDLLLVLLKLTGKYPTVWVDLDAFTSVEIGILPQVFDCHPSTIRDFLPESDMPKEDDFEGKD